MRPSGSAILPAGAPASCRQEQRSRSQRRLEAGAPAGGTPALRTRKNLAELTGAEQWASLPAATRARFRSDLVSADFQGEGVFEASPLGRAFALLGIPFGRPLPCRTGAAAVSISVRAMDRGEAWTRSYGFAGAAEIVSSVKHRGVGRWLEERAGPLVMRLAVFVQDGALVFECLDFRLRFGPFEIPIPAFLTPGRIRVAHRDLSEGRFLFTLEARHPWFGMTFRQRCEMRDIGV
jgi:hypothetical protein